MTIEEKLTIARQELAELEKARTRALTAQSWESKDGDSSRRVSNASLSVIVEEIRKKKAEIEALESKLTGKTGKAFRMGVLW
jgi:hypothetical protein